MTAACSGETSPARSAVRVAARSPVSRRAWLMVRLPAPRVTPAVWAYQSLVEPHASSLLASWRASTSARIPASRAATFDLNRCSSSTAPTSSSPVRADHNTSSNPARSSHAPATTPAGVGDGNGAMAIPHSSRTH